MGEAATTLATIDCSTVTDIAIVICVVEEPVDDAACVGADTFESLDSNDTVSPDEGQPKEVVAKFLTELDGPEPDFAEPDQRRWWRRSRGRGGGFDLATAIGESFEEAPEEDFNCIKRNCRTIHTTVASYERIDSEHSTMERVPILDQVVEHFDANAR